MKIDKIRGNNPLLALNCLLQGMSWLSRKELRRFILWPLFANLVLYSLAFALAYSYVGNAIEQLIPAWLNWLRWILWPLFFVVFFAGSFFTFTLLGNVIAAPFYGKLARRTAELLSDTPESASEPAWFEAATGEMQRLLYIFWYALPLLLLFVIPLLNILAPLLWAAFGAWCMAMEFFSYPLEAEGFAFAAQREVLRQARIGSTSLGGLVMLGLAIPVLNIIVPPTAVIAATMFVHKCKVLERDVDVAP